jgi:hypothetical protein
VAAALAVALASTTIGVWTGVQDPAVSWLLRTGFVGAVLLATGGELWTVGQELFERSLAGPRGVREPTTRAGDQGAGLSTQGAASTQAPREPAAPHELRAPRVPTAPPLREASEARRAADAADQRANGSEGAQRSP